MRRISQHRASASKDEYREHVSGDARVFKNPASLDRLLLVETEGQRPPGEKVTERIRPRLPILPNHLASTTTRQESTAASPPAPAPNLRGPGLHRPETWRAGRGNARQTDHRGLPRGAPSKWGAWWLGRAYEACHQVGEDGHRPVGAYHESATRRDVVEGREAVPVGIDGLAPPGALAHPFLEDVGRRSTLDEDRFGGGRAEASGERGAVCRAAKRGVDDRPAVTGYGDRGQAAEPGIDGGAVPGGVAPGQVGRRARPRRPRADHGQAARSGERRGGRALAGGGHAADDDQARHAPAPPTVRAMGDRRGGLATVRNDRRWQRGSVQSGLGAHASTGAPRRAADGG